MLTENQDFDEIYMEYKHLVMKVAYDYSGSRETAEDIVQSTFLKLYMHFDEMSYHNIKSWLFTVAKHQALNYIDKNSREQLEADVYDNHMPEKLSSSAEEEYLFDDQDDDRKELHEIIFAALLKKNPRWYDAIYMAYYLELPQKTVAEDLGISVGVLHSTLHRAKEWIKKKYGVVYAEMDK